MALLGRFDRSGGFMVGDTETGATAYAYPTSPWAVMAKRSPAEVARSMAERANVYGTHMTRHVEAEFHRRNWVHILAIAEQPT
jgi:hypothetical protein